jgi:RimJ/RimL family protein N-acetyltransferase
MDDAEITLQWRLGERAKYLQRGAQELDEQSNWIASKLDSDEYNFIIEHRGQPVGMIALHDWDKRHQTIKMGRLLIGEQEFVGSSPVAFEADLLISDFAFNELDVYKIHGDVMEDNSAMLKTRFYLGYTQEGILRQHYIYDGVRKDTILVSVLRDEYFLKTRKKLVNLIKLYSKMDTKNN